MSINIQILDRVGRISMSGRFDFKVHREFKEAYTSLLDNADVRELEIDMSKLEYLDSSALGMLMLLNERAKEANRAVILADPSSAVSQVLEVANFNRLFTIRKSA